MSLLISRLPRHLEEYLFISLCVLVAISPLDQGGNSVQSTFIRYTILTIIFVTWAVNTILRKDETNIRLFGYDFAIFGLLLLSIISCVTSFYKFSSELQLVKIIYDILFAYLFLQMLSRNNIKLFLCILLFATFVQGLLGIIQYFGPNYVRVKGTFYNPNMLSTFVLYGIAVSVPFFLVKAKIFLRLMAVSILVVGLVLALFFVGSRSAIVSFLIVLAIYMLSNRRLTILIGVLFAIGMFIFVPNVSRDRLLLGKKVDIYDYERVKIWKNTLVMMKEHPLGVGIGNYEYSTYPHNFPVVKAFGRYGKLFKDAHNGFLEFGAELGFLGLVALMFLFFCIYNQYSHAKRKAKDSERQGILRSAFVIIIIFLVQGSFHDVTNSPPNVLVALSAIAIIRFFHHEESEKGEFKRNYEIIHKYSDFLTKNIPTVLGLAVILIVVALWPMSVLKTYLGNVLYVKGMTLLQNGDIDNAISKLRKAIFINSGQPFYQQKMGDIYLMRFAKTNDQQDMSTAIKYYTKSISLNKKYAPFYKDLAECYEIAYLSENKEEYIQLAGSNYHKAIDFHPTNPFYRVSAGLFYLQIGNERKALEELESACRLEPNFITPRYLMAKILGGIGAEERSAKLENEIKQIRMKYKDYVPKSNYEDKLLMEPETYIYNQYRKISKFSAKRL